MNKPSMRKKGSIYVEFLVSLPVLLLVIWGTMQILFFSSSQTNTQQAAMDASRILTMELRGQQGTIPHSQELENKVLNRLETITSMNGLTLLFRDEEGNEVKPVVSWENPNECQALLNSPTHHRVVCVYTNEVTTSTTYNVEQVVVLTKAKFKVVGNFIPGIEDKFFARGKGVSQKEIAGRLQYY